MTTANNDTTFSTAAIRKSYPTAIRIEVAQAYRPERGWIDTDGELTAGRAAILSYTAEAVALRITLADGTEVVADFRAEEIAPARRELRAALATLDAGTLLTLHRRTGSKMIHEVAVERIIEDDADVARGSLSVEKGGQIARTGRRLRNGRWQYQIYYASRVARGRNPWGAMR